MSRRAVPMADGNAAEGKGEGISMSRTLLDAALGIVAAALLASVLRSPYLLDVAAYAGVLAIFVLGVSVTFGQLGYVSFGHAAFLGLGAYTAGILVAQLGWNYWAAVPLGIVPGLLLGALIGIVSARLSGAYFAIATLVVAEILVLVVVNWVDLTRGPMGLMVTVSPLPLAQRVGWTAQQGYLFAVVAALAVSFVLLRNLRDSATGRGWTAIREAPALAESLGIATARSRVLNIALSGGLASLAGALLVPKVFVLSPSLLGVGHSATGILGVILGGKATLVGPMLGGALFAIIPEGLRFLGDLNFAAFALLLLLVVRLLPGGLVGWLAARPASRRWHAARLRRASAALPAPAPLAARARQAGKVLEVAGVSRHFKGLKAVQDVSFDVHAGEILGLIGPNGAGKTTLLSMLGGFLPASAGTIRVRGLDIARRPAHRVARLGVVRSFQQTALCAGQTVATNMAIASHMHRPPGFAGALLRTPGWRARERERMAHALGCLAEVGLLARRDEVAGSLPYGEQKLLGVAMALAAQPGVLLLDEPAAGLNQVEAARLAKVLRGLRDKGMTLIVVDHNLKMLMSVVDRVIVLHHGVKIADGAPGEVTRMPEVVSAYLGTAPAPVEELAA
ncbi:Lipopolysaccharide export system ATP-binding protein LptB [Variovorax sp. WDL1]|nr:ABC transporter related [Variovorax sp. WDL1]PNG51726.1 Lipopolysaccharide export system ATP-binding protein LptB [Variovorax sp. B2]PNG54074.1 Lipopolysaccharide export system ATP-binding protein LptB [Variovorax sp. B4]VTV11546.1 Lipopolysaccharide export system ATP-binding protein LptB [Variovorax sp. WDL1]